jgi:DNA-directed RNA polymerase subunit K/omega
MSRRIKSVNKPVSKKLAAGLKRESTTNSTLTNSEDAATVVESEFGKSMDFSNTTFQQLSSALKVHVFNPTEIHTEIHKQIYIIPANKRRTSEVMSDFEYTRVKCERAQQIQNNAQIFVDYEPMMDECEIAVLEIKTKKCPLSIIRMLNDRVGEIWTVNEMDMPFQ